MRRRPEARPRLAALLAAMAGAATLILTHRQALCGAFRDPAVKASATLAEGWTPRPEHDPWPLMPPINWLADPFHDRNWRFQLNAWRPLDVLVTAHSTTQDDAWLEPLATLMLDWAVFEAAHPEDPELWNDMGSGLRAAKLAYLISQPGLEDRIGAERRNQIIAVARHHLARLRNRAFIGDSNHGLFQVHGAMALVKTLPDVPESEDGEAYVEGIFDELLDQQFSSEGVHLEHSPGYQHFVLKTLERLRHSGWYESMTHVNDVIDHARYSLRWFVFPDGLLSRMGDSSAVRVPVKWRRRPPGVMGQIYDEAGYAIVRSTASTPLAEASMLLVTGGHHSNVHKHADDLSFELFEAGRPVIVDSGKYSYSRKPWRDYTDSAAAHNTIDLVAERLDNGVRASAPRGSSIRHLSAARWGWVVQGGFERPEFQVTHHRTFLYRPGSWLVLVDRVTSAQDRQFTAWLHLSPELLARQDNGSWALPCGRVSYACSTAIDLQRRRGVESPRIQGWVAGGYHQRTANDALGASMEGRDVRLVTIIDLSPDGAAPGAEVGVDGATVHWKDDVLMQNDQVPGLAAMRRFWRPRRPA